VITDHPQGGRAALELEDHARVSSGAKLEVTAPQSPNAEAGMQMGFAESVAQKINCLADLNLSLGRQIARLRAETGSELNL
jgi:hypothetical protein